MKFLGFILLNNHHAKYAIVDINARLRKVYLDGDNEAVYATYRAITGANVAESWRVCKPLIKLWEGEK